MLKSFRSLRALVLVAGLVLLGACTQSDQSPYADDIVEEAYSTAEAQGEETVYKFPLVQSTQVKNVILFIGDGTGLAQLQVGQQHLKGEEGLLAVQRMPVTGIVKTYSSDNLITDSAAGATAYATGKKTRNGMIGQAADSTSWATLLELAKAKGMKAGVVATSSITHATPASFAAHIHDRDLENQIAEQMINSDADVMLGGGRGFFVPQSDSASEREDDADLLAQAKQQEFHIMESRNDLMELTGDEERLLGLFGQDGLEGTDTEPSLAEMTQTAIRHLENDQGFFLMVEGSQIDWAGHGNKLDYMLEELREFDKAVAKAMEFALRDEQTLVVSTADHETGGLTMINSNGSRNDMETVWTSSHHTGIQVPLFAFGPRAIDFTGLWDNTDIAHKLADAMNISKFPVPK
ncbi:MAG: alkaline phosphatase [Bacteroidota bacterium]